jgi:hypothetical protein
VSDKRRATQAICRIRALERAGLIEREMRKTAAGNWNSNIYHLNGLIANVQALELEFAAENKMRQGRSGEAWRQKFTPAACLGQRRYRGAQRPI